MGKEKRRYYASPKPLMQTIVLFFFFMKLILFILMYFQVTRYIPSFLSSELGENSENLGHEKRKTPTKIIDITMESLPRS